MTKHIIWACAVAASIAVIAITTRDYNIERDKQQAFMVKACVDAGGQWQKSNWNFSFECTRPNGVTR